MSIVRMRKVFRKRIKARIGKRMYNLPSFAEGVFALIILIFVAGAYYTFGGPADNTSRGNERGARVNQVVAVVNGEKIARAVYDLDMSMRQTLGERDATQERWTKVGLLNSLIDSALMRQATKREKIKVSSADIRKKVDEEVEQTLNTRFPEKRALKRYLKKQNQTLEEYKAQLQHDIGQDKERIEQQIAQDKLKEIVEQRVTLTDDELKDSYTEVKASHILIKPEEEAAKVKPAAGQTPSQQPDGDALAKQKADALLAEARKGADFAKLAKANSQDPGSGPKGGDLGWFKRGTMVKEFDEVAFKLQPGQISEVFKSPFGYHFIKVMDRRASPPKDFEKNKATYREQVLSERKYRAWGEYQEELKKQASIEIQDPELKAYSLLQEAEKSRLRARPCWRRP
jgi:foldase protein PrsA